MIHILKNSAFAYLIDFSWKRQLSFANLSAWFFWKLFVWPPILLRSACFLFANCSTLDNNGLQTYNAWFLIVFWVVLFSMTGQNAFPILISHYFGCWNEEFIYLVCSFSLSFVATNLRVSDLNGGFVSVGCGSSLLSFFPFSRTGRRFALVTKSTKL